MPRSGTNLLLLGNEEVHFVHQQQSHALALGLAIAATVVARVQLLQVLRSCSRRGVLPGQRLRQSYVFNRILRCRC